MAHTAAARLVSTEDLVLEILLRVSAADVAALFRCAVACKRWRALVADRSFLQRCFPERSTLLGVFNRHRVDVNVRTSYRLFFVPPPSGSVLGTQPRVLTSIIDGLPDDDSHFAYPLAARCGLLLLRLVSMAGVHESVHLAVCDPLAGTCHLLPPLHCKVWFVSCTVLTGADMNRSDCFKVLAMVYFCNYPNDKDDQECSLYTFSSTESRWRRVPTTLFHEIHRIGKRGFEFPNNSNDSVVVYGVPAVAHWLVTYRFDDFEEPEKYYTLEVSADDDDRCHTLLTELQIPADQLMNKPKPTLHVAADGSLSLFCIDDAAQIWQLHVWRRVDRQVWIHTRAIELNLPRQPVDAWGVRILPPVEKSGTFVMVDDESEVRLEIDLETGEVQEQRFHNTPTTTALTMNIEWQTLFASRLGSSPRF